MQGRFREKIPPAFRAESPGRHPTPVPPPPLTSPRGAPCRAPPVVSSSPVRRSPLKTACPAVCLGILIYFHS